MTIDDTPRLGNYWSTTSELEHLRLVADLDPLQLLGAYNGIQLRERWDNLDELAIRATVLKLAKKVIYADAELAEKVPEDWYYTRALLKELKSGGR